MLEGRKFSDTVDVAGATEELKVEPLRTTYFRAFKRLLCRLWTAERTRAERHNRIVPRY